MVATQVFDEYLEHWGLRDFALATNPDEKIIQSFLEARYKDGSAMAHAHPSSSAIAPATACTSRTPPPRRRAP